MNSARQLLAVGRAHAVNEAIMLPVISGLYLPLAGLPGIASRDNCTGNYTQVWWRNASSPDCSNPVFDPGQTTLLPTSNSVSYFGGRGLGVPLGMGLSNGGAAEE